MYQVFHINLHYFHILLVIHDQMLVQVVSSVRQGFIHQILHMLVLVFIFDSKFIAKPLFAESQLEVKLFAYVYC